MAESRNVSKDRQLSPSSFCPSLCPFTICALYQQPRTALSWLFLLRTQHPGSRWILLLGCCGFKAHETITTLSPAPTTHRSSALLLCRHTKQSFVLSANRFTMLWALTQAEDTRHAGPAHHFIAGPDPHVVLVIPSGRTCRTEAQTHPAWNESYLLITSHRALPAHLPLSAAVPPPWPRA